MDDWNLDHVGKHECTPEEAESVVEAAKAPFPQSNRNDTWLVEGKGVGGRFVRVVYLVDPDGAAYVIHSPPLNDREKRRHRRRRH